ncbi:hypothetical protein OXX59_006967 [Metschnikowia pulcherrima]
MTARYVAVRAGSLSTATGHEERYHPGVVDSLISNPSWTVINTSVQACRRVSKRVRKGLVIRMNLLVEVLEGVCGDTIHRHLCVGVAGTVSGLSMGRKLFLQLAESAEDVSMRELEL